MMMEAADFRHGHHFADFGWLDRAWLGAIHIE
jgi:hypothetical protein